MSRVGKRGEGNGGVDGDGVGKEMGVGESVRG